MKQRWLRWCLVATCTAFACVVGQQAFPSSASAGRGQSPSALSVAEVPAEPAEDREFQKRRTSLVQSFARELALHSLEREPPSPHPHALRRIAAGLYALRTSRATSQRLHLEQLPAQVERYLRRIKRDAVAGTEGSALRGRHGDYDFVMKELVSLLYLFRDAPHLLTNEAAHALFERGVADYAGVSLRSHLTFRVGVPLLGPVLVYPETENHVLMLFSSAYLANQWLLENPRHDPRLRRGRYADRARFERAQAATEAVLLDACARILRNGFWEANARPYQGMTLHALMNLQTFARSARLRIAARNALDYAATKFAFQSLGQRRMAPYRRTAHYAKRVDLFATDALPFIFDTLAGGGNWPDEFVGVGNPAGHAFWASLLGYRVPVAIRAHMQSRATYWTRAMTRFSAGDYRLGRSARYADAGRGPLEYVPELYFRGPNYLLSAGGRYNRYPITGDTLIANDGAHDSDFLSRPTSLITREFYGRWRDKKAMNAAILNMPGEREYWKSDNLGVYRGLAYGYYHDGDDRHLQWPMTLPPNYRAHLLQEAGQTEFALAGGRAVFAFVDLTDDPNAGFYLVLARFSKSAKGDIYRNYARGLWEVVPSSRFASVHDLKRFVLAHNPAHYFSNGHHAGRLHYRYHMTTHETVELDARVGARQSHCDNPIRAIWAPGDAPDRDAPQPLAEALVDRCNNRAVSMQPLLDARQLDADGIGPGIRVAFAPGDGRLSVEDPDSGARLYLDSRDPHHPKRWERHGRSSASSR